MTSQLLLAAAILSMAAAAQTAPSPNTGATYVPTMTLDVASIRESIPNRNAGFRVGGGFSDGGGSLTTTNTDVMFLLEMAYGLDPHYYQGLPQWTNHTMYNIEARADEATNKRLANLPKAEAYLEHRHMIQTLLAERFKLKVHVESRDAITYELVVSKGGPKLLKGGTKSLTDDERRPDGKTIELHQRGNGGRGYEFIGRQCHMAALVKILSLLIETQVTDHTGLTGTYDFDLQYSQHSEEERQEDPAIWPLVPDAVKDQLGLQLKRTKGQNQILVIDNVDPPSQN